MRKRAIVREVGPRDGLQMVKTILPSARKLAWCRGAAEAGIRDIEVTSFVPPKAPQFADAEEVARGADVEKLIVLRREVESWLPGERFSGAIARAGIPKTYCALANAPDWKDIR